MEARIFRALVVAAVLIISAGARYRTANFIIEARDPQLARQLGEAAERYRRQLAIAWLGKAMPDWSHPCPITVRVGPHLGAGGATTFIFDRGEVFGWRMNIQGPVERLFDSVLPHEITHMVFASHFRQPLPRWADEGAATTVEHISERMKHRRMLIHFLKSNRGIPFSRMFRMKEYPRDLMPLYAQGYSVAEYLIQRGGRRRYVAFLGDGLKTGNWSTALQQHYGFASLGALQNTWLAWVKQGCPPQSPPPCSPSGTAPAEAVAVGQKLPRPEPNLIYRSAPRGPAQQLRSGATTAGSRPVVATGPPSRTPSGTTLAASPAAGDGWRPVRSLAPIPHRDPRPTPTAPVAVRTQTAHPQGFQRPRQTILEWGRQ
ncbi:MAG TPA: hypothetical protein EYH34_13835 [Planctomycetes bacterium]|nr:hypothetical protein [Planctomycetota bacterium]